MLNKFLKSRNIEPSTIKGYRTAITQFEDFHNMTIKELIDEAWDDEENINNINKRRLKERLLSFRTALIETQKLESTTINNKLGKLQSFYTHFGITFPKIKGLKNKKAQLTYFDLPNKKHITLALNSTGIQNQALILFLASSGTGKSECASITIRDFVIATEEYHKGGSLQEILDTLWKVTEPLVPTFQLTRLKTSKTYYTFCTPEASFAIIRYLNHELKRLEIKNQKNKTTEKLDWDAPLFGLSARNIGDRLARINDNLEFGFKGKYRFFRPHTLRKFHASNIGLSAEYIDELQGRRKNIVHDTYIKTNPRFLKKVYMNAMDNVTINLKEQRIIANEEYNLHLHLHFHEEGVTTVL